MDVVTKINMKSFHQLEVQQNFQNLFILIFLFSFHPLKGLLHTALNSNCHNVPSTPESYWTKSGGLNVTVGESLHTESSGFTQQTREWKHIKGSKRTRHLKGPGCVSSCRLMSETHNVCGQMSGGGAHLLADGPEHLLQEIQGHLQPDS